MADKIGLLRNTFVSRTAKFDGRFIAFIPIEIYLHVTPFSICDLAINSAKVTVIKQVQERKVLKNDVYFQFSVFDFLWSGVM